MKKRMLAVILTLAMAASMLTACGKEGEKEEDPGTKDPGTEQQEPQEDEGTGEAYTPSYPIVEEPITVTCVVVGQDMTTERLLWQKLEELTNIHVDFINIESEQFNVFMASNEWPDFFLTGMNNSVTYEYGVLGHKFVDYNEYADIMPNLWAVFEQYPLAKQSSTQSDGGIYGLPRIEESVTTTMARMHYRSDFLEEHNLKEPTTLDEFYEVLVACRDLNGGKAPLVTNISDGSYLSSLIYPAFGEGTNPGTYDDGTGTVIDDHNSQQYRDYLTYLAKLYKEGLLHQEYLTLDNNSMLSLVQEGSAIFFAECAMSVTEDMFADGQIHLGTMSPLVAKEGDTPICKAPRVVMNDNYFVINAESPYVEEICKLVDIAFATEEVKEGTGIYGLAFNYGPEGVCIHLNEDGTYGLTTADGGADFTTDYLYKEITYGMAGILQLGDYVTDTPGNNQIRQTGYRDKVLPYATAEEFPSRYFTYTDEEQAVIDQYSTEYGSYLAEMEHKFIMGVEDINDDAAWEGYCKKLEEYGMNELVKVNQAAYDRFRAE